MFPPRLFSPCPPKVLCPRPCKLPVPVFVQASCILPLPRFSPRPWPGFGVTSSRLRKPPPPALAGGVCVCVCARLPVARPLPPCLQHCVRDARFAVVLGGGGFTLCPALPLPLTPSEASNNRSAPLSSLCRRSFLSPMPSCSLGLSTVCWNDVLCERLMCRVP